MILQHKFLLNSLPLWLGLSLMLFPACEQHPSGDGHHHESEELENGHHEADEDLLELTAEQMKTVGIILGKVERKNLRAVVRASGSLEVPPQNKAELTTLIGGIITKINVLEGAVVVKGQALASLENTEFLKMQQEYISLKNAFTFTDQEYQRQKELNAGNAGTGKVFQQSEANYQVEKAKIAALEKQLEQLGINPKNALSGNFATQTTLRAPISGTVSHINAKIGTFAEPARPLLQIVDNSQIHCDLLIYEKDLHKVKAGQKVNFVLTNQDSRQISGQIYGVNSSFENESKAVLAHARINGTQNKGLIPGMYVSGLIDVGDQLVNAVPLDAVVQEAGKNYLFIVSGPTPKNSGPNAANEEDSAVHFQKIEVATGVSELGYVEISPLNELPADAVVVVKGAFYLLSKASGPAEHDH